MGINSGEYEVNKMKYKKTILYCICIMIVGLSSCKNGVNTIHSKYFTDDGHRIEQIQTFSAQTPSMVKFFVEVSGSMNGFFRSNEATNFKHDVWSITSNFVSNNDSIWVFTEQNKEANPMKLDLFREKMNKGEFVSSASTDVPDMITRMLEAVDATQSEVGVLISDMKYDPIENSAIRALLTQYTVDIRNIMTRHNGVAVCLIAATSNFLDKNLQEACANSPYYYLIVGEQANVVFMRNFLSTLLKHNNTFVDEIEWGIDYLSPSIKVTDQDYLSTIEENRSFGDFEEECSLCLSIDITSYPWSFEKKDTLLNYFTISAKEGSVVKIIEEEIQYDITYDDGKQLKRTAIARIPVKVEKMYQESDVLEIRMTTPEVQRPNSDFLLFFGAEDVNDISRTFSIEGLMSGFYSSMERYKESKPVHILITTK